MLRNASHPKRKEYLDRFVVFESGLFIRKFYTKYSAKPQQKKMQLLQDAVGTSLHRLAALYRFVFPDLFTIGSIWVLVIYWLYC